jgi:hypothetical protein
MIIAAMRAPRFRAPPGHGGAMGFYILHFSGYEYPDFT